MPLPSLEVSLDCLISKSVHRHPHRRLNEIENMLADLAQLGRPVDVAREVRSARRPRRSYSPGNSERAPTGDLVRPLEVCAPASGAIPNAREGWISLYLGAEELARGGWHASTNRGPR